MQLRGGHEKNHAKYTLLPGLQVFHCCSLLFRLSSYFLPKRVTKERGEIYGKKHSKVKLGKDRQTMPVIETVWARIESHAGEKFRQIRGGEFTYAVVGGHVIPDRTNQQIPKSHFEAALAYLPLPNTIPVQHLRGPSYIYAILMDQRIRESDW